MRRLISHLSCPRDCFWYEQENNGIKRKWESTPLIAELAYSVADYRRANNLPRATKSEAMFDIEVFTCARDPAACYEESTTEAAVVGSYKPAGCRSCGH